MGISGLGSHVREASFVEAPTRGKPNLSQTSSPLLFSLPNANSGLHRFRSQKSIPPPEGVEISLSRGWKDAANAVVTSCKSPC